MELYNEDTGKLLCRQEPVYGTGTEIFNEEGYIAIPPCLWSENGENPGLVEPDLLTWNTNLMAIKRNNNTNKHYGEMASWQMRGILVYLLFSVLLPFTSINYFRSRFLAHTNFLCMQLKH